MRNVARSAVRRMPPPLRERVRTLYRVIRTPDRPRDPQVRYSADVSDRAALFAYLNDTNVFGDALQECQGYLNDAIERFRITLSLVEQMLSEGKLLELGSNPYFITRLLLRRGLDVRCANWFGDPSIGTSGTQVVTGVRSGEEHVFEFDHFNVESDRFPYPNDEFNLVLCCEILEHLPHDPVHMLAEIHRVLKRNTGRLLLTTPNPVRIDNLSRMLRGDNVYEELSGYGTYGRHNREYTTEELKRLLVECGYEDVVVFASDIHEHQVDETVRLSGANLRGRGDNIFAVGRAVGEPRWPYPKWLYASQHALARRVRPDVRVGYNDALQSAGLHDLESDGGAPFRWTGADSARLHVTAPGGGSGMLFLEGYAPPAAAGRSITLTASIDGTETSWDVLCDGRPMSLSAAFHLPAGDHVVRLSTDRTWRPCDVSDSRDARQLGIRLTRVSLDGS